MQINEKIEVENKNINLKLFLLDNICNEAYNKVKAIENMSNREKSHGIKSYYLRAVAAKVSKCLNEIIYLLEKDKVGDISKPVCTKVTVAE